MENNLVMPVAYKNAYLLVQIIDTNLDYGYWHYRNMFGDLLVTLDQVILAILNGELELG